MRKWIDSGSESDGEVVAGEKGVGMLSEMDGLPPPRHVYMHNINILYV